jgi:DNA repair protein RadA
MAKKKKEMELEDLPNVGSTTADKLREAGYHDLMSLAVTSPGQLVDAASVGESAAKKIINAARNNLDMDFISGNDLVEQRKKIRKLSIQTTYPFNPPSSSGNPAFTAS